MPKETYIKVYKEEQDNVSSLQLDGVNDHVIINSLTDLSGSAITLECWYKGTNAQSIIRQQSGSDFISLVWSVNRICILSNDGGTGSGLQFPSSIHNGEWQHLAMTWNQNTTNGYTIYVNGLVVAQRNSSNTPINNMSVATFIGSFGGTSEYASGNVDEVRIWNVARTQAQIQASMNRRLTGTESGLIAYYRLDDNTGTTAVDSSGNGRNGTLVNGPVWTTSTLAPITKSAYKGFFYDFGISSFSSSLNGGLGNLTLDIPRKFDDFGEGSAIDFNNEIRVFVYDDQSPQGTQIYTGYIVGYEASVDSNESVKVDVAGYISRLERDVYRDNTGNYKKSYSSTEVGAIMKDIVDKYRQYNFGTSINYTGSSISSTGKNRGITFNNNTYLDALRATFELTNVDWYWYLDTDNLVYLKQIPSTPTHLFMFEKDIISINMSKSISQMTNEVVFWNGLPSSDGSYIATKYNNSASQIKYGRWAETKNDSRYKVASSADDAMARYINNFKDPVNTVEIEIADNNYGLGYDIESIKPGQTCKVRNISTNNGLSGNMLITSVEYKFSSVKIVVADVRTFLERSIFDLSKRQQSSDYITDGPNTYV